MCCQGIFSFVTNLYHCGVILSDCISIFLCPAPSTSAGDYRELTRVPLRGEECCGVGRASRDSAGFGAMEEGLISRTLRRHHLLEHTCGNNGKSYWPKYCRQENLIKQDFGSETPLVNNLQRILGFFTEMRSKFVSEERCFIFSILTTFVVTPGHYNKRK